MNLTDLVIARAMEKVASSMEKEAAAWTPLLKTVSKPGLWGSLLGKKAVTGMQNFAKVRPTQALGGGRGVVYNTKQMRQVAAGYGKNAAQRGRQMMKQYEQAALAGDPRAARMYRRGQQLITAGSNRVNTANQMFSGPNVAGSIDDVIKGGGYNNFFTNNALPYFKQRVPNVAGAPNPGQPIRNAYSWTGKSGPSFSTGFSSGDFDDSPYMYI